jgi:hypothetical protein
MTARGAGVFSHAHPAFAEEILTSAGNDLKLTLEHAIKSWVKPDMKPAMKFAVLAVFVSVSGIAIALMAALTPSQTAKLPSIITFTFSNFVPSVSTEQPSVSQPLKPGVYQSKPYTCMVLVPKPTHDDCCNSGILNTNSSMTIIKPDSQLVPVPQKGVGGRT